mmetsp:Transcript_37119/g.51518  ORF Transcript_37119/g.51518 Transcript_37119/m.51518 type:complete len:198 (-) Transcript_37119:169-762(-)
MSTRNYELGQTAYCKLILHAIKHPSSAVHGVLLGTILQDGTFDIIDAVPLFHGQLALAALLEAALCQVEHHFEEHGLKIVGYYHANERSTENDFSPVARKISDKIFAIAPNACALLVDNERLSRMLDQHPQVALKMFTRSGQRWKTEESDSVLKLKKPSALSLVADFVRESRHSKLFDFGEHLEDPSRDWLNPRIME